MRAQIVGAGNVATHLTQALQTAGVDIGAVCSRTSAHARELAERLGCTATDDLRALPAGDLYIICVSDDAVAHVVDTLCPLHPDALFVHTAGSLPLSLFAGKARRYGVLYPLQTFSKGRNVDFRSIPIYIEGSDAETETTLKELATKISDHVASLSSERRKYLHLSAVFACNFVNHCYALAGELMQAAGRPFEELLPLIDETARKVHALSPEAAQTGPAARGDLQILKRQEALLRNPLARDAYHALSRSIQQRAHDQLRPKEDTRPVL